jgi:20S proteasome alpha/beta subunit
MCQGDAQMMIGEGRSYVRIFLERLAKENSSVADLCNKAAREMKQVVDASNEMFRIRGGVHQSKEVLDNFMKPEIRQRTAALIDQALKHELNAIKLIKEIIETM